MITEVDSLEDAKIASRNNLEIWGNAYWRKEKRKGQTVYRQLNPAALEAIKDAKGKTTGYIEHGVGDSKVFCSAVRILHFQPEPPDQDETSPAPPEAPPLPAPSADTETLVDTRDEYPQTLTKRQRRSLKLT
jgi:hypothetical protein